MSKKWLSVPEVAEHLGVRPDTVYKWLQGDKIPAHKVGRLWRFDPDEIDR